ncbi:predicted protein [Sclerotinia sclerotiorum 1980 UF-70]|uniref:Uncharacterized protein n=1 Tax=Sclerotinia sclerotiorum (strain ATCC 18683 / 1980 / Ss-1) TaxID=665079 RepID=A7EEY8_SCLS1|nr:predicted protein [Sclerotinia sclerotiorum 1980 UF-70]EDO01404.1 predicted protein [Sclerotinia sclerotiorum 1980 UF-70]
MAKVASDVSDIISPSVSERAMKITKSKTRGS